MVLPAKLKPRPEPAAMLLNWRKAPVLEMNRPVPVPKFDPVSVLSMVMRFADGDDTVSPFAVP
jgi:hypothetical protein